MTLPMSHPCLKPFSRTLAAKPSTPDWLLWFSGDWPIRALGHSGIT